MLEYIAQQLTIIQKAIILLSIQIAFLQGGPSDFIAGSSANALLNLVGLETGILNEFGVTSGTLSVQSTTKRTGGYALRVNPVTTAVGVAHLGKSDNVGGPDALLSVATIYARFYFRYATKPATNNEPIFAPYSTGNALKFELRLNSSGNLVAYDSTGTLMATGTTVLLANTWYRIEVQVGSGATGSWEVKIDGTSEISGTGNLVVANHGRMQIGKSVDRNNNTVDFFYDDIAVSATNYIGAGQIEVMQADGDGTYTDFTIGAGGGADWTNVDEIPSDDNTTYLVSTLSTSSAQTVTLESASSASISGTINAVKGHVNAMRDGASNGSYRVRIRSGTTDSDGNIASAPGSYDARHLILNTDPADSLDWTTSDLDALEVGAVEGEITDKTRITQVAIMVDFVPSEGEAITPFIDYSQIIEEN